MLVGCSAPAAPAEPQAAAPTPIVIYVTPPPAATAAAAAAEPTPEPTTEPEATEKPAQPAATPVPVTDDTYKAGETVTLTEGSDDWAEITVTKVKQRTKYSGDNYDDVPEAGNVFIEMFVTYLALAEGVDYNSFDWQLYVDDVAVDTFTFVLEGPEPTLGSGNLPKGRKAQGWLVYEIPKAGRAVLSYGSNMFSDDPPVFEVLLRSK